MLYGSSRIGVKLVNLDMLSTPLSAGIYYSRMLGRKQYEGTNHLGNVLSVFTDLPKGVSSGNTIGLNLANVLQASDYYAFGMTMPGRTTRAVSRDFQKVGVIGAGAYGIGSADCADFRRLSEVWPGQCHAGQPRALARGCANEHRDRSPTHFLATYGRWH